MAPGGLLVEMHRTFALDGPYGRDLGEVFARRIHVETPDGVVPVLAHEDAVIQLALHAAGHGAERLAWLVDLAGYARRQPVDWTAAAARARGWGVAPTVWLVWREVVRTVAAPIPASASRRWGCPGGSGARRRGSSRPAWAWAAGAAGRSGGRSAWR